jgi:predicted DNA binding protein
MRYVELRVRPEERWFHPIDRHLANDPDLRRGTIHDINRLEDGTAVLLYEVAGPKERIDDILEAHGTGLSRETTSVGDYTLVWAYVDPEDGSTSSVVADLLDVADRYRVVVDTPFEFTDDNELRLTLVAEADVIRDLFAAVPDAARVTVERTGDYEPERVRLFSALTARQQEVVLAAIEVGYDDEPRRATYDDVAEAVGCSATTVGEHLRKVERRFVRELAPTS